MTRPLIAVAACLAFGLAVPAAAQDRTTADGVYTADQAATGKGLFDQRCANCHGVDMMGTPGGPGLAGGIFKFKWADKQSLGDLYSYIQTAMPADAPGTMTPPQYAAITAHILAVNGYPAGDTEIAPDAEALAAIPIVKLP